jgi:hypothetical protein
MRTSLNSSFSQNFSNNLYLLNKALAVAALNLKVHASGLTYFTVQMSCGFESICRIDFLFL